MIGYRTWSGQRKGSAWWIDEIKEAIKGKRRAYEKNAAKECGRRNKNK